MGFAIDKRDGVAYLRYSNGPRNFLTLTALEQLRQMMTALNRDRDVRVIVLSGVDDNYMLHVEASGLQQLFNLSTAIPGVVHPLIRGLLRPALFTARHIPGAANLLFRSRGPRTLAMNTVANVFLLNELIERSPKITIAAMNGPAVGGGLEISLCADYRIAMEDDENVIGLPEIVIGLMPGFGGTARLPGLIGEGPAAELLLSGNLITPREAARLGLVSTLVPRDEFHKYIVDRASQLATYSNEAVRAIKGVAGQRVMTSRSRLFKELKATTKLARSKPVRAALDRYTEMLNAELALPPKDQASLQGIMDRMRVG